MDLIPPLHPNLRSGLRHISPLDWLMLALALVSIGLLIWETFWTVAPETRRWIVTADYVICGVFAMEFLYRWHQDGWRWRYVRRNWYEILGMIPVQHPGLRGFRLFRVVRIVILLARFGMAADRAFGDEFTYRLISRFKKAIVDSISGAITAAVLDHVAHVLARGTYTQNVSRALEAHHNELRAMILEKLRNDRQAGRLAKLPFYNEIVEAVINAVMRVLGEALNDRRMDALVADILHENITQIRQAVEQDERAAELTRRLQREQQPL